MGKINLIWPRLILWTAGVVLGLLASHPALAQDNVHVVARGENLSTIASGYGLSLQELAAYNGIANPNLVFVGQQIAVPGSVAAAPQALAPATGALPGNGGYYTVVGGDTLSEIAKRNGMTTGDLLRLNGLSNADLVWVGQKLRISARVAPVAAAPEQGATLAAAADIYVVRSGDTLARIAAAHETTVQELLVANGLPNPNFVYVGQRLRVKGGLPQNSLATVAAPTDGRRWIEVDLADQTLTAWQGDVRVMHTSVSTGRGGTPTVTGQFAVGNKYRAQRMTGPGYDLPNVPWVMYFHQAYAIHGVYWHTNFGAPASHGCVNMRLNEAEMLYNWAPAGTEVNVHY